MTPDSEIKFIIKSVQKSLILIVVNTKPHVAHEYTCKEIINGHTYRKTYVY